MRPLISICIPTYNGGQFFIDTLASIVPYLNEQVKLVISDDGSEDKTYANSVALAAQNSHVSVYQNEKNLGMDENFTKVARLAIGKYVWFCGQDDRLGKEIIDSVTLILETNNISILNVNFAQYNNNLTKCITPSFFARASFKEFSKYQDQDLIIFKNPKAYFKVFTQPPSFLPAVVMLRQYWDDEIPRQYYGTHFVQLGVLLSNMHKGDIGAFTKPLIKGRIPDNQWQSDGNKLFSIMCGDLRAKKIAFSKNLMLPKAIYVRDLFRFTLNYPFFLYHCKVKGFNQRKESLILLKNIYGARGLYYLFMLPLMIMPLSMLRYGLWPLGIIKRVLFRFRTFEKLRG